MYKLDAGDPLCFLLIAVAGGMNQRQLQMIDYLREEKRISAGNWPKQRVGTAERLCVGRWTAVAAKIWRKGWAGDTICEVVLKKRRMSDEGSSKGWAERWLKPLNCEGLQR